MDEGNGECPNGHDETVNEKALELRKEATEDGENRLENWSITFTGYNQYAKQTGGKENKNEPQDAGNLEDKDAVKSDGLRALDTGPEVKNDESYDVIDGAEKSEIVGNEITTNGESKASETNTSKINQVNHSETLASTQEVTSDLPREKNAQKIMSSIETVIKRQVDKDNNAGHDIRYMSKSQMDDTLKGLNETPQDQYVEPLNGVFNDDIATNSPDVASPSTRTRIRDQVSEVQMMRRNVQRSVNNSNNSTAEMSKYGVLPPISIGTQVINSRGSDPKIPEKSLVSSVDALSVKAPINTPASVGGGGGKVQHIYVRFPGQRTGQMVL